MMIIGSDTPNYREYRESQVYQRLVKLPLLLSKKSHFLFGARQTGKSTLIDQQLGDDTLLIDLLDSDFYQPLLKRPKTLSEMVLKEKPIVVIDEVQKLPSLLDEVQRLLKSKQWTFLLTGSSPRKLKRGGANLLAGRAHRAELLPLVTAEIPDFKLMRYLNHGGLPSIYDADDSQEELAEYVDLYLREEVLAEALVRDLQPFARCLDVLGHDTGCEINLKSIGDDCGVTGKTVANYISILEDTLVGYTLPAFTKTNKRKPITRSKFYFFDVGIARYLSGNKDINKGTQPFGSAFEHFIINEVRAYISYSKTKIPTYYWRSTSGMEVDLVIGNKLAIEIKGTDASKDKHFKGLKALREEGLVEKYILVSLDPIKRKYDNWCEVIPWQDFCSHLWQGDIL